MIVVMLATLSILNCHRQIGCFDTPQREKNVHFATNMCFFSSLLLLKIFFFLFGFPQWYTSYTHIYIYTYLYLYRYIHIDNGGATVEDLGAQVSCFFSFCCIVLFCFPRSLPFCVFACGTYCFPPLLSPLFFVLCFFFLVSQKHTKRERRGRGKGQCLQGRYCFLFSFFVFLERLENSRVRVRVRVECVVVVPSKRIVHPGISNVCIFFYRVLSLLE